MNFDFYLFGTPDGYDQYPLDDKEVLFQSFYDKNCPIQLTLYRNAELVYFTYIRNINAKSGSYFGMSIVFNGAYPANLAEVMAVFDSLFVNVVNKGRFLRKDRHGHVVFTGTRLAEAQDEIEELTRDCHSLVENRLNRFETRLPAEYVVQERIASFSFDSDYLPTPLDDLLKFYNRIDFTKEKQGSPSKLTHRPNGNGRWMAFIIVSVLIVGGFGGYLILKEKPVPENTKKSDNVTESVQKSFSLTSVNEFKAYEYEGEFNQDGLPDGEGRAVFDDSSEYIGGFKNGELNGYGEWKFVRGDWEGRAYKGIFKDNVIDSGMLVSGSLRFLGSFRDMEYWDGILVQNDTDTMNVKEGKY